MPDFLSTLFSGLSKALANIGHSPVAQSLEAELPTVVSGLVAPELARLESQLNTRVSTLEVQVAQLLAKAATPPSS
jgi:hypothetical protein